MSCLPFNRRLQTEYNTLKLVQENLQTRLLNTLSDLHDAQQKLIKTQHEITFLKEQNNKLHHDVQRSQSYYRELANIKSKFHKLQKLSQINPQNIPISPFSTISKDYQNNKHHRKHHHRHHRSKSSSFPRQREIFNFSPEIKYITKHHTPNQIAHEETYLPY